jgi:LuxR family maltose regulon positive regulatory protein
MEMELQRNSSQTAERWFKRQASTLAGKHPNSARFQVNLVHARLLLVEGRRAKDAEKLTQAYAELEDLLPILQKTQNVALQIKAYILLAQASAELEDERMLQEIGMALMLAEPEEIRQYFLDEGLPISRILQSYMIAIKQDKVPSDAPSLAFVSDLLFRVTGKPQDNRSVSEPDEMEDVITMELLTAREAEVLELAARGRTNGEIARDLCISINTVKRHLNNIFMKLGVTTRVQAIRVARQRGLIQER